MIPEPIKHLKARHPGVDVDTYIKREGIQILDWRYPHGVEPVVDQRDALRIDQANRPGPLISSAELQMMYPDRFSQVSRDQANKCFELWVYGMGDAYWFGFDSCSSESDLLGWIMHLTGKTWCSTELIRDLIREWRQQKEENCKDAAVEPGECVWVGDYYKGFSCGHKTGCGHVWEGDKCDCDYCPKCGRKVKEDEE